MGLPSLPDELLHWLRPWMRHRVKRKWRHSKRSEAYGSGIELVDDWRSFIAIIGVKIFPRLLVPRISFVLVNKPSSYSLQTGDEHDKW